MKLNHNDQKRSVDDRLADNTNSQVSQVNQAPNDVMTDLDMSAADINPGRRNQRPSSNHNGQELGENIDQNSQSAMDEPLGQRQGINAITNELDEMVNGTPQAIRAQKASCTSASFKLAGDHFKQRSVDYDAVNRLSMSKHRRWLNAINPEYVPRRELAFNPYNSISSPTKSTSIGGSRTGKMSSTHNHFHSHFDVKNHAGITIDGRQRKQADSLGIQPSKTAERDEAKESPASRSISREGTLAMLPDAYLGSQKKP